MLSATRAPAAAAPPTLIRPRTSVPSVVKKRLLGFSMGEL
ncbi:Uncharacterised protein [Mycobacteroides abscessus subsp. abscessus]|nr:Uncharacterised protein [Mycobacteroides abscessus subsp. abscessus]